jgi:hypothetical protein
MLSLTVSLYSGVMVSILFVNLLNQQCTVLRGPYNSVFEMTILRLFEELSVVCLNEIGYLGVRHWFILPRPITKDSDKPIHDTEVIMSLFSDHIVIDILFLQVFQHWLEIKAASSSDSRNFIFSVLQIYLRAVRIEAIDL